MQYRKNTNILFKSAVVLLGLCIGILFTSCGGKISVKNYRPSYAEWPEYGGDTNRTNMRNSAEHSDPVFQYRLMMRSMTGKSIVAGENLIFAGTLKGYFQAFDIHTGEEAGALKIKKPVISAPVYDNRHIYFASIEDGNTLYCYNISRGKYVWRRRLGEIESSLTVSGSMIYAINRTGVLFCLDKLSGDTVWVHNADSQVVADILVSDGGVYIGTLSGDITALDKSTGHILWEKETESSFRAGPSTDGKYIYLSALDNQLIAMDAASGNRIWSFPVKGSLFATPSIDDKQVVFGCGDGYIYSVDKNTGRLRWSFDAGTVVNTSGIIIGNRIYFGTLKRLIYGLDCETGEPLWEYPVEGKIISNPIYSDGKLIFPVEHRYLYVFEIVENK